MSHRKMRSYDKEFKLNAVKLYIESEQSFKQVSEGLGNREDVPGISRVP